jgi:hypothetical protein
MLGGGGRQRVSHLRTLPSLEARAIQHGEVRAIA